MRDAPIIDANGVYKTYHRGKSEVHALRGVSLVVEPGTIVAVTGPSGSGKSTLLNILAGLDRASRGRVLVAGTCLGDLDVEASTIFRRRHIGFVFQFFNLLPAMSARRNVALPMVADRRPPAEIEHRVDEVLAAMGLTHRASHRPSELSGGEQQRVAVARALVMHPPLLLADEPTGNLDSATGADLLRLFRDIVRQEGISIVLVTHSATAAAAADRVLVIRDGAVVDEGAPTPRSVDADSSRR